MVTCKDGSDGSAKVTATGGWGDYSYLWSDGQTTATATDLTAGKYYITVTDLEGCTARDSVVITEPTEELGTSTEETSVVTCKGGSDGSAKVTATGGWGDYSYLWSDGQTTATATDLAAGKYYITVTDIEGCTAKDSIVVTEPTEELGTSTEETGVVTCKGGSDGSAKVTATGGWGDYSYLWSDGQTTATATDLAAGKYYITVTDMGGCTAKDSVVVTEPAEGLDATIEQTVMVSCADASDGEAMVTATGGWGKYVYLWSNGETSENVTGLSVGTYSVTITDSAGCEVTREIEIQFLDETPPTINCAGDIQITIQSAASCLGAVTVPSPSVNDNCGVASVINDFNNTSNASGNYPVGETVVTWTVTDDSGNQSQCSQTITVISSPLAVDDNASTNEDVPVIISVLNNDLDCDNNLLISSLQIITVPTNGTATVNSDGTVTYTPNKNYNGADQFIYQICDADGQCDEATVRITVIAQNDPPVAVDDINNTFNDVPVNGNVLTNDYDVDGNIINASLKTSPSNGTLTFNPDGTYIYTPNAGYLGEDIFTYQISDGDGGTDQASVYLTIISDHSTQNQPPVANEDVYIGKENNLIEGNILSNDYDPDGDPLVFKPSSISGLTSGSLDIGSDGTFIYTPENGYTGKVTLTYEVCDDFDPAACNTASIIFIIDSNINSNTTVAVDDAFFIKINTTKGGNVAINDYDPEGDNTTYSLVSQVSHGNVTFNSNGSFSYTPNNGYIGPDQFIYQVCDDGSPSACDKATAYINVSEENHPPVAVDDLFDRDNLNANVLSNDYDPDGDNIILNVTPVETVKHGVLVLYDNGTFSYTPDEFYFGRDSFNYQICDDALVPLCDEATVVLYVDTDQDGIANADDLDDDNDGILDVNEGDQLVDTDGDGFPDSLDIDSDNDGITDNQEGQLDSNYILPLGIDSNGNGWDDAYDDANGGTPIVLVDTDGDGKNDLVDTDSDNDGIADAIEGHDANHDGVADVEALGFDSDHDGLDNAYDIVATGGGSVANVTGSNAPTQNTDGDIVSDWRDVDSDNDGLTDQQELNQVLDSDNDGLANYLDIDSDGDGITDNTESQLSASTILPSGLDTDGDGLDDAYDVDNNGTPINSVDTDQDGTADYLDEDSDDDSIPDLVEAHDANGDGVADNLPTGNDTDNDGLDDAYDTKNEFVDLLNVLGTNTDPPNSDNDIAFNWRDIDDDNDGILTSLEANNSSDNDNDGLIDYLDIDSDNDGIVDNIEAQDNLSTSVYPKNQDSNGNGLDDSYDTASGGISIGYTDTDSDGIPDYLDEDSDNDHVPDYIEGQDVDNNGQADVAFAGSDSDDDGLDDSNDTVAGTSNNGNSIGANSPLQDSDNDGINDWRDVDDDGDGLETSLVEDDNGDGDPTNDDCNFNGTPNYLDQESCDLLVPNAFSPNGDGINDYFRIRGMYQYPDANLEVYSRWGVRVFAKDHYGNIPVYGDPDAWWDGHANINGNRNSEILPAGTYLYILKLDGSSVQKGTVYINR